MVVCGGVAVTLGVTVTSRATGMGADTVVCELPCVSTRTGGGAGGGGGAIGCSSARSNCERGCIGSGWGLNWGGMPQDGTGDTGAGRVTGGGADGFM